MTRNEKYLQFSSKLSSYSDDDLASLLAKCTTESNSVGGKSGTIDINMQKIFFKKIQLSDTEMLPQNKISTANFFKLPCYFQYGLGSLGFGVC